MKRIKKKKKAGKKTRGERSWKCGKVERSLIGRKEGEGFLFRPPPLPQACLEVTMHDTAEGLLVLMLLLVCWLFAGSSQCKVMQTVGRQIVHASCASALPRRGPA